MSMVRWLGSLGPLLLAPPAAIAQGTEDAGASASVPSAPSVTAPPNAPVLLSPGVAPDPKVSIKTKNTYETREARMAARAWFGWQTLAIDIVTVAGAAAMLRTMDRTAHLGIAIGAGALFLASGPIVHFANGSARVADSLIVRVGGLGLGTFAGAVVLAGLAGCSESTPCKVETVGFAAIGAGLGAFVTSVVDATIYAWKPTTSSHAPVGAVHASSVLAPVAGGAVGVVSVRF